MIKWNCLSVPSIYHAFPFICMLNFKLSKLVNITCWCLPRFRVWKFIICKAAVYCDKLSPPIKYGIATSTFYVGLDAGVGFGPSFLGLFTHMFSYSEIFGFMAALAIITMLVYFLIHGRHVTRNAL